MGLRESFIQFEGFGRRGPGLFMGSAGGMPVKAGKRT
jgi:hypothetical protein